MEKNLTTFTEEELPALRHWIYLTNLLLYAFEFPVSLFSALTVFSSSVLHPNLRLVLVCQNACFFLFAFSRTIQIAIIFAIGPNAWQSYKSIQCAILFTTLYGNMIGHVLLLERLLATFFVKDYEHKQKLWFPLCWFPLLFTVCLVNAYSETYQSNNTIASLNVTLGTMISLFISLAMSVAEIFILSLMGVHNRKAYHKQRAQQHGRTLTERYQLSENIRTSQQLGPTFLFHFANICCTTVLGACMYFNMVSDIFTLMAIIFWLNSLFNTVIESSVIIRHPILRRNAKESLARLTRGCCFAPIANVIADHKVHASCATMDGQMPSARAKPVQNQPKNLDGKQLIHTPEGEDYFRLLAGSWKVETPKTANSI